MHYEKFQDGSVKCIEDEIPFEIPQGWEWERFGNYTINRDSERKPVSLSCRAKQGKIYDYYGASGIIDKTDSYIFSEKMLLVGEDGANLLTRTKPIAFLAHGQYWVNNHAHCIDMFCKDLLDFLCGYINSINLEKYVTGSAQPKLNQDNMNRILVPVPPVNEQRRIITTIEKYNTLIQQIDSFVADTMKMVEQAKSHILDLAIRGKLVPQDPNDEPVSVLLERIRTEKEELIKQGKIKRDKKESVIFKGEDNSYYIKTGKQLESIDDWGIDMLPDNLEICCLGELCDYGNCINVETADIDDSAWILDLEDIEKDTGRIVQKVTKRQRNSVSTKHRFHSGQVLYSKLRPYLNKVVLTEEDGYCTSEILPLDFAAPILPSYARYYLMSPTFLAYADRCSYGVKMPRLSTEDGKKSVITVPPLLEQQRIVTAIENCFDCLKDIVQAIS